jgi:hypothetical protein
MLTIAGSRQLGVEFSGIHYTVPDDPYITLSYYLKWVASTDYPHSIPHSLCQWRKMRPNAFRSIREMREMLEMANRYSLNKMQDSGFFILLPDEVLSHSGNKHVMITATSREFGLLVTNTAALGVVRASSAVVNLMMYRQHWGDRNFSDPMGKLQTLMNEKIRRQEEEAERRRQAAEAEAERRWQEEEAERRRQAIEHEFRRTGHQQAHKKKVTHKWCNVY